MIASQVHKLLGIRNGIDMDLWDPENNQWLPMPFNSTNVVEGKAAARKVRATDMQEVMFERWGRVGGKAAARKVQLPLWRCYTNASVWAAGATISLWES